MTVHHVALETARPTRERPSRSSPCSASRRSRRRRRCASARAGSSAAATQVHVLYADDPVVPPSGHVAMVVARLRPDPRGLRAAGHTVEDRNPHWGSPRAFATAPGGHRVELMAFAPA